MTVGTLQAVAENVDDVLSAGRKLYDGLADPERRDYAAELLAERIEQGAAHVTSSVQGFDADGAGSGESVSLDETFTLIASELDLATVALAADGVIAGRQEATDLDAALNNLTSTNVTLQSLLAPATAQGFAAEATRSADLPSAVAAIGAAATATIDEIAAKGGKLAKSVLTSLPEVLPKLKDGWDEIKTRLHLDKLGDQLGRFAQLALKLLASALDRLSRLVPGNFLATARDSVRTLVERLDADEPEVAVFGWTVGVDGLKKTAGERLARGGLDKSKLDHGTDLLAALGVRYDRYMGVASAVTTALGVLHRFSGLLAPVAAQVAVATVSMHVLVLVAVVAISADFLDTGTSLGLVRGARLILEEATE